jgi:hypothetical protein
MANNLKLTNAAAKAACDAIVDLCEGDTPPALLRIYDGAQPTDPDTAIGAQTLLAELTFSNPAFGAAADGDPGGEATASAITKDSAADATGTAAWFTVVTGTAFNRVMDGSVGTADADMIVNTTAFTQNSEVSCSAFVATQPES